MILAVENKITKLEMYEQMKESPVCPLTDREVVDRPFISESIPRREGPIRSYPFTSPYIGTCVRSNIQFCEDTPSGSSAFYRRDGNTNAAGAFGYKIFATDVYPEYEKARSVHKALSEIERRLTEDKQNESEICNCTAAPVTETKVGYMPIETDLSIARYR
ncbi:hypothetical protein G5I_12638 [Acromyrmex echinatior]|uniref:Uncharacterized protein n=1 Tax=Acromyrmex echinatior TaxID=103372 RepID=F4X2V7_ACREC|nr:hypothetical protein G5I_12638 [Acromyrmex echinatior]